MLIKLEPHVFGDNTNFDSNSIRIDDATVIYFRAIAYRGCFSNEKLAKLGELF